MPGGNFFAQGSLSNNKGEWNDGGNGVPPVAPVATTRTNTDTMTTSPAYAARFPLSVTAFEQAFPDACPETEFAFFEGCLDRWSLPIEQRHVYEEHLDCYRNDELVRDTPIDDRPF